VRDGHRHRLNSQVLLKPPSLMLSLISPSDPLDRMAVAVFAMDPNRRVFDHHRVLSPAEVVPLFVDLAAATSTRNAGAHARCTNQI
jgi:hypothetical protein